MENFGFALLPKIPSDLPLPVTRRRSARLSRSANGTPPPGPSALTNTRPPLNARSSCLRFSKGEPGVVVAAFKSAVIALSAAAKTAGTTEAVAQEPPETGPCGSIVSPSTTYFLDWHTGLVRGEQGENCIGAGADILYPTGDTSAAIIAQLDIGRGVVSRGDPRRASHAPAKC